MSKNKNTEKSSNEINTLLAAGISAEKAKTIADKLTQIAMLINSIECDFHGTDLKEELLKPDPEQPTLWCQFYDLEKIFNACS